ncbi:hypothetical protein JCM10213v2_000334 [Rhodosporidiobolus nylandii]
MLLIPPGDIPPTDNGDAVSPASSSPKPASPPPSTPSSLRPTSSSSSSPVEKPYRQWPLLPTLVVLLPLLALFTFTSVHLHYALPTPNSDLVDANGTAVFSEAKALEYVRDLAAYADGTPRYRIVGTKEMVQTDEYLLRKIEEIKAQVVAAHPDGGMQVEVWHQVGDGTHLFDFMDKKVWKKYFGISNVIVRLSDGTAASKANAILVNAHSDSTLPSPGAADDLVGVAVQLEALRVMGLSSRRLTNAAIFLFNGAEESLQDASHLFITQHPLKDSVRGVINLEAAGNQGKEIVFQATNEEFIRALGKTPSPYATVIASEIFQTGIILSDTDFRQMEHGGLAGIDAALVQNSYTYHTMLDTYDSIEPGAVQHMGENTLALLNYFTSPATSMGNSPSPTPKLPQSAPGQTVFFSALGGKVFVVYSRAQATAIYGVLAALVAVVVTDRVALSDTKERRTYVLATLSVLGSLVAALVGANVVAGIMGGLLGKGMSWFRNEAYPLTVFGPPALLGVVFTQYLLSNRVRSSLATVAQDAAESSLLEHASLVGLVVYYTGALLAGHAMGVGSSYLFAIGAGSTLLALLVNDYLVFGEEKRKRVHLSAYVIGQSLPLLLGVEGIIGFLDLFVPLTGRLGAEAPVDHIIASLVSGVGYLTIPMLLPFVHRYGASFTARILLLLTLVTAGTMGWFSRPAWGPYDAAHPKRLLCLFMENTTTSPPAFHLHIATTDGMPFASLVERATEGLTAVGSVPEPTVADDWSTDWDTLYPVSQFLTTYKIPLPSADIDYVSVFSDTFRITATRDQLNSVTRTRSLDLILDHPGIIWPVLGFTADVVSWDLPEPAERGQVRHHVKSVASYGVTQFPFSVTLQLTPEQFAAALREDQRRKGQRADASAEDAALASLKIDYSGLDVHGMYPASFSSDDPLEDAQRKIARASKVGMQFFERFSKKLEKEPVDAMLLSAIAGVAYV